MMSRPAAVLHCEKGSPFFGVIRFQLVAKFYTVRGAKTDMPQISKEVVTSNLFTPGWNRRRRRAFGAGARSGK